MSVSAAAPPPQSLADEEAVLSEILDHGKPVQVCLKAGLEPEHFYIRPLGAIYRAARAAAAEGHRPDELTVWATLQRLGFAAPAEDGVDRERLAALTNRSTNPFGVGTRVERLIELASERARLTGALKVIEAVREPEGTRKADLYAEGLTLVAADFTVEAQPTSREEVAGDFFDYLESEEPAEVFKLPWEPLNDCVLGGFRRQQMSVLGAWSGFGKTWVLDQMMGHFHRQGAKVAIFATEMSRRERVARFVTTRTGISTKKLLLKDLTKEETKRAAGVLSDFPFAYFEANGWSETKIAERIVFDGYDIAAIDTVNLIPGYEEKVENASRIAERFMALAHRAECHVILVSQFNRERDKLVVKPRPTKRDLRATAMLEANAHQILFLHRDQDEDGRLEPTGELFLAKVRNGIEGSVLVAQNSTYLTFSKRAFDPPGETSDREERSFFDHFDSAASGGS